MRTIQFTVYGPTQGYFIPFLDNCRTTAYSVGHLGSLDAEGAGEPQALLERIFAEGNGHGTGPGYVVGGRSMSTGDVVHLQGFGVWLCEPFGWAQLDGAEATRVPFAAAV